MIGRRAFLRTLGAAIAAGFAKVETKLLERPGPLVGEFPLPRWRVDPYCPRNTIYFLGLPVHFDESLKWDDAPGLTLHDAAAFDAVKDQYEATLHIGTLTYQYPRKLGVIRAIGGDPGDPPRTE